jgi:hypothetical protein
VIRAMETKENIKDILFNISMLAYAVSCILPCLTTRTEELIGYQCLLSGIFTIFTDIWAFLIWSSNIYYITIIVRLFKDKDVEIILPAISFLLSLGMIFHRYLNYDIEVPITNFNIGYYLWVTSHLLLLVVCILKKSCALSSELSGRQYD